jgi:hypothetical protein
MEIRTFAKVTLLIFLYSIIYAFYTGLLNPVPTLGDSYGYHIPISLGILNGSFLIPHNFTTKTLVFMFNPGASEAINSLLFLIHIPLTLSNVFAITILSFCTFFLGLKFKLEYYYALLFALTITTLTVIYRWVNYVNIDIWLAVFSTSALILFKEPKKSYRYFFLLGFVLGMLVGSKYSSWPIVIVLLIVYGKSVITSLNFKRFLAFLLPFSIFGLFWYIRNYLAVGNPVWPICTFSLPCDSYYYVGYAHQMWYMTLQYPSTMINAFFGEYKLWILSPLLPIFILYAKLKRKDKLPYDALVLCFIGIANFVFLSVAPTDRFPWVMVSSFRYSYSMFIPLILSIFILASYYKKEVWLGFFAIANIFPAITMSYYPKLILFYLPIAILCFYLLKKYEPKIETGDVPHKKKLLRLPKR